MLLAELRFEQQIWLTILDKFALAALAAIGGFWLNRILERFKSDRARENERERLRAQKQLDYLERQLSEFYYPIYIRLYVDGAVWTKILARDKNDELRKAVGEHIEKNVLLPNHEAIVSIIQSKIHLSESDKTAFEVMLKYIRHVSVYRAIRAANCFDKDPIALGEPFPTELLPLIEKVTAKLQLQYDSLLEPAGQSVPVDQSVQIEPLRQDERTAATESLEVERSVPDEGSKLN
jgi:hypothetical protein